VLEFLYLLPLFRIENGKRPLTKAKGPGPTRLMIISMCMGLFIIVPRINSKLKPSGSWSSKTLF